MFKYNILFLSMIDKLYVYVDNVCKYSCSLFVDGKKFYICKGIFV